MKKLISHRVYGPIFFFALSALVALIAIQFLPDEKPVPQVPAPVLSPVEKTAMASVCIHLADEGKHSMTGCRIDFAQLKPDPLPKKDTTGQCSKPGDYFFELPADPAPYTVFAICEDGGSSGKFSAPVEDLGPDRGAHFGILVYRGD